MPSKISIRYWEENKASLLRSLATTDRKSILDWKGNEAKAFNWFHNHGIVPNSRCKICNTKLIDFKANELCGDPVCAGRAKGDYFRGKKRPEHAERMKTVMTKLVAEGKIWTAEHRKNNKRHLKSLNKTLDRRAHSQKLKSVASKRRTLIRAITNTAWCLKSLWSNSDLRHLTQKDIEAATDKQVCAWATQAQSLKSLTAMSRNPNMGAREGSHYKRVRVKGIRNYWEDKRSSITVRSHLEYSFVHWLMARTDVTWRYEWTSVQTDFGFTRPDFKVYPPKGKPWVIETKGVFLHWRDNDRGKLFDKILSVVAFCRAKGYRYTVLSTKHVRSPDPKAWVDLTRLTDLQVIKYLIDHIPGALNVIVNRASR